MGQKTEAFLKGGGGCFAGFLLLGLLALMVGGRVHLDIGGAIMLFVMGGVLGLIVLAIYNAGKNSRP